MKTALVRSRADAAYRVSLKRIIARSGEFVDGNVDTETAELERSAYSIGALNPAIVATRLEELYERGAKAWVDGNNSGNSAQHNAGCNECDFQRSVADRVCALFGIKTDYPGLYPSFSVKGHTHYNALAAVKEAVTA